MEDRHHQTVYNGDLFKTVVLRASIDSGIEYLASPRGETLQRMGLDGRNQPLFIRLHQQAPSMMEMVHRLECHTLRTIAGNAQSQGKEGDPRGLILTQVKKGDSDITPNALKFNIELLGKPSSILRVEKR